MVNKSKKGNYTRRSSRKTKTLGGEKGENFLNEVNKVVNHFGLLTFRGVDYKSSPEYSVNDNVIANEVDYNKTTEELLQKIKNVGQTDKCGITGTFGALKDTECEAKKYEGYLKLKIISEKLEEVSGVLNKRATKRYKDESKKLKKIVSIFKKIKDPKNKSHYAKQFINQKEIVDSLNMLKTESKNLETEFEGLKDHYKKKTEEKRRNISEDTAKDIDAKVTTYINKENNRRTMEKQSGLPTIEEEGEEEGEEETGGRKTKRRRRNKRKTRRVKKH